MACGRGVGFWHCSIGVPLEDELDEELDELELEDELDEELELEEDEELEEELDELDDVVPGFWPPPQAANNTDTVTTATPFNPR